MARILLVRHGQSTWNAESRWQGQANPPLSDLGRHQARAAADRLAVMGSFGALWTSNLIRARETTATIGERLGLSVRIDTRLAERDAGEWTGLTRAEIEERYPGALAARRSPPGFESDESLLARAMVALTAIAGAAIGDSAALVVSHGGVLRALEREFGEPPDPVPNLAGRWLEVDADHMRLGDRELLIDPDDVAVTVPRSL